MTLILGLRCDDGVVLAADSMATEKPPYGPPTTRFECEKLVVQHGLIWGCSGPAGLSQIIRERIEQSHKQIFTTGARPTDLVRSLVAKLKEPVHERYNIWRETRASLGIPSEPPLFGFLLGTHTRDGFVLINIDADLGGELIEHATAQGSAAKTALALVRRFGQMTLTRTKAEIVAYRTLDDAIAVEPMGIGPPIRIARCFCSDGKPTVELVPEGEMRGISDTKDLWVTQEIETLERLDPENAASTSESVSVPPQP